MQLLPVELAVVHGPLTVLTGLANRPSAKLIRSLQTGSVAASPALCWLHVVHELAWKYPVGGNARSCRERPDLLAILRQLVTRASLQLRTVTYNLSLLPGGMAFADDDDSGDTSDQSQEYEGLNDADDFVDAAPFNDEDDTTVACVDELSTMVSIRNWPSRCAPLNMVLAQSVFCLLSTNLAAEVSQSPSGDYSNAMITGCITDDQHSAASQHALITTDDVVGLWQVKDLFRQDALQNHTKGSASANPVWWQLESGNGASSVRDLEMKVGSCFFPFSGYYCSQLPIHKC